MGKSGTRTGRRRRDRGVIKNRYEWIREANQRIKRTFAE